MNENWLNRKSIRNEIVVFLMFVSFSVGLILAGLGIVRVTW